MGKIYEKTYEVNYYDTNYRLECKIASIMNYFGDIGSKQSEELGVGFDYLEANHCAWVFYKYKIDFKRYPKYGEKITVKTMAKGFKKFYASRIYQVYDEAGEIIIEAEGIFLLMDTIKRRAIKIPLDQYEIYGVLDECNNEIKINKIEKLQEVMFNQNFKVRYSDIDSNKHVNNVKYVEWAIESVPIEKELEYEISNIEIVFQKECSYGAVVNSSCEIIEEDNKLKILHKIEDDKGVELTAMISYWRKIV